jgi:hypothetical protein
LVINLILDDDKSEYFTKSQVNTRY